MLSISDQLWIFCENGWAEDKKLPGYRQSAKSSTVVQMCKSRPKRLRKAYVYSSSSCPEKAIRENKIAPSPVVTEFGVQTAHQPGEWKTQGNHVNVYKDNRSRLLPVVLSARPRGNGHKVEHRRFPPTIRKHFCAVRVKHYHKLPRSSGVPALEIFKSHLDTSLSKLHETSAPAWAGVGSDSLQRSLLTPAILWHRDKNLIETSLKFTHKAHF